MSKRLTDRERLLSKLDHLTDIEFEEVLDFVSRMEAKSCDHLQRDVSDDDLLTTLSAAHENRRARQVFEWEAVRRRVEARPGSNSYARR